MLEHGRIAFEHVSSGHTTLDRDFLIWTDIKVTHREPTSMVHSEGPIQGGSI
jgi:hypothetical protein